MQLLQEKVEKEKDSKEEMIKVKKEIVDFHGEMVLLENYSALNYTGNLSVQFQLLYRNILPFLVLMPISIACLDVCILENCERVNVL